MTYPSILDSWIARSAYRQPALLPRVLALSNQQDWIRAYDPPLLFRSYNLKESMIGHDKPDHVLNTYKQEHWAIGAKMLQNPQGTSVENHLLIDDQGKDIAQQIIFTHLHEQEKDRIMRSFFDDMLFANMYMSPRGANMQLGLRAGLPQNMPALKPRLLTTKPVLLPAYALAGFNENKQDMQDYLDQNISPVIFKSDYFDEHNLYIMQDFAATLSDVFCPTQFIATRWEGVQDLKNGEIHIQQRPQDIARYTQAKLETLEKRRYRATEVWNIHCVTPFDVDIITTFATKFDDQLDDKQAAEKKEQIPPLRQAVRFLEQAEKHFINPYYKSDPVLAMLEEKLAICPDFWPTHYSKVTQAHYNASENMVFPN